MATLCSRCGSEYGSVKRDGSSGCADWVLEGSRTVQVELSYGTIHHDLGNNLCRLCCLSHIYSWHKSLICCTYSMPFGLDSRIKSKQMQR